MCNNENCNSLFIRVGKSYNTSEVNTFTMSLYKTKHTKYNITNKKIDKIKIKIKMFK